MAKKTVEIIALETIKYDKKFRVPGTDSATFECELKVAKKLVDDGLACLPQNFEQASQPTNQPAAKIIADAEAEAKKIIAGANSKAAEIVKSAETKAAGIIEAAGKK